MKQDPKKWIFPILALLWAVLVFLDYLNKHPNHINAFVHFKYSGFVFGILLIYGFHILYHRFIKIKILKNFMFSGLWMISLFLMIALMEFSSFSKFLNSDFDAYAASFVLYRQGTTLFLGLLILIPAFLSGNWVLSRLQLNWDGRNPISDIAIGLLIIVQFILLLGVLGWYTWYAISIVLILISAINYRQLFPAFKMLFLTSWFKNMKHDFVTIAFILIGVSFTVIALTSMHIPFPLGFDSRNFYMNISKLVAEQNGLIANYQPYAWSLFISLGYTLFHNPLVSLFLSFMSGLLCLAYLFHFSIKIIKLRPRYALLVILLFFMMPAVTNQFHTEIKIDFGLLLFQLLSLDILLHLLSKNRIELNSVFQNKSSVKNWLKEPNLRLLILLGFITGFAMSIKFIHIFFIISMLIIIWTFFLKKKGMMLMACLSFAFILIFRVDEMTGLRSYHLAADTIQWIIFLGGILMIIYSFIRDKVSLTKSVVITLVISISSLLSISPWMIKNYHDTQSLSPKILMMGKAPGNPLQIDEIIQNYENYQNQ